MRKFASSIIALLLFAAATPSAEAYFKMFYDHYNQFDPIVRDLGIAPTIFTDDWPDWIGVPAWVSVVDANTNSRVYFGQSLKDLIPEGALYDEMWQSQGWPEWIGAPSWVPPMQ